MIFNGIKTIRLGFGLDGVLDGRALVTGGLVAVLDCKFVGLFVEEGALGDDPDGDPFGADVVDILGLFSPVDPDSF